MDVQPFVTWHDAFQSALNGNVDMPSNDSLEALVVTLDYSILKEISDSIKIAKLTFNGELLETSIRSIYLYNQFLFQRDAPTILSNDHGWAIPGVSSVISQLNPSGLETVAMKKEWLNLLKPRLNATEVIQQSTEIWTYLASLASNNQLDNFNSLAALSRNRLALQHIQDIVRKIQFYPGWLSVFGRFCLRIVHQMADVKP